LPLLDLEPSVDAASPRQPSAQPWRCLWRGLDLQITMTLPLRRITRQWSQMGLTLGLTFMICSLCSLSSYQSHGCNPFEIGRYFSASRYL
jgi:hypothetical protein